MGALVKSTWEVLWPDGSTLQARTATDLLTMVAKFQWRQPCSIPELKERLRERAFAWSGAVVNDLAPDAEFLWELGAWGVIKIRSAGE